MQKLQPYPPNYPTKQRNIRTIVSTFNDRNLLDFLVDINPALPPSSPPPVDEEPDPPSPSTYNFDAHFGYSPTPSPPPEIANQLTQPQITMGMYKLEPGTGGATGTSTGTGSMGPPMPVPEKKASIRSLKHAQRLSHDDYQLHKTRYKAGNGKIGIVKGRRMEQGL